MDYLAVLRIIFMAVNKSEPFNKYFNGEMKERKIRILDYFIQMYNSGIDELKIMATELILSTPFELKLFMSRYPEHASDMISIVTFALTLQQNVTILSAIRALEYIISSSSLLSEEIIKIIGTSTEGLFKNLTDLLTYFKDRSYFLKSSNNLETSIITASLKIVARIAPFIKNLNIPVTFKVTEDYILTLETQKSSDEFDWVDLSLLEFEIEEAGHKFRISSVQTLLSIFVTLDLFRSKTISYSTIASNILLMSTLKHKIGLEKFLKFLKKIFAVLSFTSNRDIETFFASCPQPEIRCETSDRWSIALASIRLKPLSDKFLLQRVFEAILATISYAIPLLAKDEVEALCQGVKESIYTLVRKTLDPKISQDYLVHNLLCLLESSHYCVHHHIVMQRDFAPQAQFKLVFQIIGTSLRYVQLKQPQLIKPLQEHSFRLLLELLYSADKTQAVGALIFLTNLSQAPKWGELFGELATETLNGLFSLMNRLSCKFYLTVQKKAHELCKSVLKAFKETRRPEDRLAGTKRLIEFFAHLIPVNKHYEQRILLVLMNHLIEGLSKGQICEIMCGEPRNPDEKISIAEVISHEGRYFESGCPLYLILDYVLNVLRSYRQLIQNKNPGLGAFKDLSYENCSSLTSAVLVAYYLFKWSLPFKLFEENNFDPAVQEILDILLEIIKENEEFNEKKMEGRGSSVKLVPRQRDANGDEREERQSQYRTNQEIHYQNVEYKIFVDDYDFQVQGWSILVDAIVNFLSTFLMKREVYDFIKQKKNIPINSAEKSEEKPQDCGVFRIRNIILEKMFELFSRVESRIRDSVEKGFKILLKAEQFEKEIMSQERMEQCFRPLLAFMQNPDPQDRRSYMNENSMYCFKKIFMLFKTCFNLPRLFERISDYLKSSEDTLANQNSIIKDEDISQIGSIFSIITLLISNHILT